MPRKKVQLAEVIRHPSAPYTPEMLLRELMGVEDLECMVVAFKHADGCLNWVNTSMSLADSAVLGRMMLKWLLDDE